MTNISIEIGSKPYALDDYMTFRYAILRQLLMQARGMEVDCSGSFKKTTIHYIFLQLKTRLLTL